MKRRRSWREDEVLLNCIKRVRVYSILLNGRANYALHTGKANAYKQILLLGKKIYIYNNTLEQRELLCYPSWSHSWTKLYLKLFASISNPIIIRNLCHWYIWETLTIKRSTSFWTKTPTHNACCQCLLSNLGL